MDYIYILAGLILLFVGGEALVRGSVTISQRLGLSTILIGMVVVGFGTSAPELLVSIKATLQSQPDIALGNVVGSNIANILLILGVGAMISPIICSDKIILRDAVAVFIASALLFFLSFVGLISRPIGVVMLVALLGYLIYAYMSERRSRKITSEHQIEDFKNKMSLGMALLVSGLGIAMLIYGADILVLGATSIARQMGVSEAVIGLSLVAVGTSLPELAAAISASLKKESDVIIGNILGSNLFNILNILGVTAMIKPVPITGQIASFDIPFCLLITGLCLATIFFAKKIARITGFLFIVFYAAYIAWIFLSGAIQV